MADHLHMVSALEPAVSGGFFVANFWCLKTGHCCLPRNLNASEAGMPQAAMSHSSIAAPKFCNPLKPCMAALGFATARSSVCR